MRRLEMYRLYRACDLDSLIPRALPCAGMHSPFGARGLKLVSFFGSDQLARSLTLKSAVRISSHEKSIPIFSTVFATSATFRVVTRFSLACFFSVG